VQISRKKIIGADKLRRNRGGFTSALHFTLSVLQTSSCPTLSHHDGCNMPMQKLWARVSTRKHLQQFILWQIYVTHNFVNVKLPLQQGLQNSSMYSLA